MAKFCIIEKAGVVKVKYVSEFLKIKLCGKDVDTTVLNNDHIFYASKNKIVKDTVYNIRSYLDKYKIDIDISDLSDIISEEIDEKEYDHDFLMVGDTILKHFFEMDGYLPEYDYIGYDTIRDIGTDHSYAKLHFIVTNGDKKVIHFKLNVQYYLECDGGDYRVKLDYSKYGAHNGSYCEILDNIFKYIEAEIDLPQEFRNDALISRIYEVFKDNIFYCLDKESCFETLGFLLK